MLGLIEDEIRTLLTSADVSVRVLALVLLENRFDELDEREIRGYLDTARQDADPIVVRQARRVDKAFRSWRLLRSERSHAFNLFEDLSEVEIDSKGFLRDYDLTQLREAALDILDPLLVMLKELARDERKRIVPWVIRAVGLLKHPRSLHLLSDLIDEGGHEAAIADALCRYASPEARVLLLKMAADEGAADRVHAMRRLGTSNRPEALEILVRALEGKDEALRSAAAEALGESEHGEAIALLLRILESPAPPSLQAVAIRALARRKAIQAVPLLVRLLGETKDDDCKAAIISALRILRTDAALHALMLHLTATNDRVRANVVEALAAYALPDDRAMMIFPPLLSDPHPRVRANAVLAVFRYDPRTAEHALEEMFKSFTPKMRAAAAYCAMLIQTPATARHLTTMLLTEHEVEVVTAALHAFERFQNPDSVDAFLKLTTHPQNQIRTLAIKVLGRVGDASLMRHFGQMARKEKDSKIRATLVSALSQLSGSEGINVLPPFLKDPHRRVVANAIEGLNRSDNIEAVPMLLPMVQSSDNRIRANAILALWNLGEFKIVKELDRMLQSRDEVVVLSGLYILGQIGLSLHVTRLEERPLLPIALRDHWSRRLQGKERKRQEAFKLSSEFERAQMQEVMERLSSVGEDGDGFRLELSDPQAASGLMGILATAEGGAGADDTDEAAFEDMLVELETAFQAADRGEDGFRKQLQDLSDRYPESPWLAQTLLPVARQANDAQLQARCFERLLVEEAPNIAPLLTVAREEQKRQHVTTSLRAYVKLCRRALHCLDELAQTGEALLAEGKLDPAATCVKTITSMLHLPVRFHFLMGNFFYSEKRFREAFPHLLAAHLNHPTDAEAAAKLAVTAGRCGRLRFGLAICDRLLASSSPSSPLTQKVQSLRGKLKLRMDELEG